MSETAEALFVEVLLPLPVAGTYTYRVPMDWEEYLHIGQRVVVQFGIRKIYAGIVTEIKNEFPEKYNAKYILEILDEHPLVTIKQLKFWQWMANYYLCFTGEIMAAALPAGYKLESETVISLNPDIDIENEKELDAKEYDIIDLLQQRKTLNIKEIVDTLALRNPMKYIKSLYIRNIIFLQEDIKEKYKPKLEPFISAHPNWKNNEFTSEQLTILEKKAPKQAQAMLAILSNEEKKISKHTLVNDYSIDHSSIAALEKKQLIIITQENISRLKNIDDDIINYTLTPEQENAVKLAENAFKNNSMVLLEGVTGSGKTFVYIELIKRALEEDKQVLYLVPEIALTEQLTMRLQLYFGNELAVWHSYYTSNEKTELYEKILNNEKKVIVGTRSSIFLPMQQLGLIVVDEEHESSYKQFEKRPHFNARDTAIFMHKQYQIPIILGSATPSFDLLYSAHKKIIAHAILDKKYYEAKNTVIQFVHASATIQKYQARVLFAEETLKEIHATLEKKQQVIIYQNRKGYVPFISCDRCGSTLQCKNCDITLTYYKSSNMHRCSYCGYTHPPLNICNDCGSNSLSNKGWGTERAVEELQIHFHDKIIVRFDQDSIRKRNDFVSIYTAFDNGEIDILVGTQLLGKGLDFNNVGLVVIPEVDNLLRVPDYKTNERAYQAIMQVSGRAGRRFQAGKVIIQGFDSTNMVLNTIYSNDFETFYNQEIAAREVYGFPPFTRLIKIIIKNKDFHQATNAAKIIAGELQQTLGKRIFGPSIPSISKIRNYYIMQILIKIDRKKDNTEKIKKYIYKKFLEINIKNLPKGTLVDFDVDPV